MFQSAPHFSSEANTREKIVLSRQLCFNPRLTSAARRTFHPLSILRKKEFQSAPHFSSEANSLEREESEKLGLFQSAPHFSSEANTLPVAAAKPGACFNPRLTSAARRTCPPRPWLCRRRGFNPRLTSAARRTQVGRVPNPDVCVSIRASLQQRGER